MVSYLHHLLSNSEFCDVLFHALRPSDILSFTTALNVELSTVEKNKFLVPWREVFTSLKWYQDWKGRGCRVALAGAHILPLINHTFSRSVQNPPNLTLELLIEFSQVTGFLTLHNMIDPLEPYLQYETSILNSTLPGSHSKTPSQSHSHIYLHTRFLWQSDPEGVFDNCVMSPIQLNSWLCSRKRPLSNKRAYIIPFIDFDNTQHDSLWMPERLLYLSVLEIIIPRFNRHLVVRTTRLIVKAVYHKSTKPEFCHAHYNTTTWHPLLRKFYFTLHELAYHHFRVSQKHHCYCINSYKGCLAMAFPRGHNGCY